MARRSRCSWEVSGVGVCASLCASSASMRLFSVLAAAVHSGVKWRGESPLANAAILAHAASICRRRSLRFLFI